VNPLFEPLAGLVKDVLDRVLPDPALKQQAQAQAFELINNGTFADKASQALALAQVDVNKADANSGSTFRGGWRPFIGWTCGGALFSQYMLRPWVQWIAAVTGHPVPPLPGIDDNLWQLLGVILGNAGLRTYEKVKGLT